MAGPDLQVLATLEHPQEVRLIWPGPWLGTGDPPEAGPRVLSNLTVKSSDPTQISVGCHVWCSLLWVQR